MIEENVILNDIDWYLKKTIFSLQDWAKSAQWEEGTIVKC